MSELRYTKNPYGIKVCCSCGSCAHKDNTRVFGKRFCSKHNKEVAATDVCDDWLMNKPLKKVGASRGKVKSKDYLMYLLDVRVKEAECEENGEEVEEKPIEQIRAEFEQEHGSIFMSF